VRTAHLSYLSAGVCGVGDRRSPKVVHSCQALAMLLGMVRLPEGQAGKVRRSGCALCEGMPAALPWGGCRASWELMGKGRRTDQDG